MAGDQEEVQSAIQIDPCKIVKDNVIYYARDLEHSCKLRSDRHLETAQSWERWGMIIGLSAAVTGVVVGFLTGSKIIDPLVASVSSTLVGVLVAVQAFLKTNERVEAHKRASDQWTALEEPAKILWAVDLAKPNADIDKAQQDYKKLIETKSKTIQDSPTISQRVEKRVPATEIALTVWPMIIKPGETVSLRGTLIAEDSRKKVLVVSFSKDDQTPIELALETGKNGDFRDDVVNGPVEPGNYLITAYHEGYEGRARLTVLAESKYS